jgi:hypothetical protein
VKEENMGKLNLESIELKTGSHAKREDGVCAMELVAWMAGEKHSDAPECACPVITKYVIRLNDRFTSEERQLLKPYLPRIIGTRDTLENQLKRAKTLAHAALTVFAPMALEARGYKHHAEKMRAIPMPTSSQEWLEARGIARAAAAAAYASAAAADAAAAYAASAADASAAYAAYAASAADADSADSAADAADAAVAAYASAAVAAARKPVVEQALKYLDEILKVGKA